MGPALARKPHSIVGSITSFVLSLRCRGRRVRVEVIAHIYPPPERRHNTLSIVQYYFILIVLFRALQNNGR